MVRPAAYDTRDCLTYACPNDAEPGDDYCDYCRRQPEIVLKRIPPVPTGLREAILDLVPLLGRYELEAARRSGDDLLVARGELRAAVKRVVTLMGQT